MLNRLRVHNRIKAAKGEDLVGAIRIRPQSVLPIDPTAKWLHANRVQVTPQLYGLGHWSGKRIGRIDSAVEIPCEYHRSRIPRGTVPKGQAQLVMAVPGIEMKKILW